MRDEQNVVVGPRLVLVLNFHQCLGHVRVLQPLTLQIPECVLAYLETTRHCTNTVFRVVLQFVIEIVSNVGIAVEVVLDGPHLLLGQLQA